jgi:hypothetical protein
MKNKEKGNILLETSLVLVVFLTMLIGVFDFGQVFFLRGRSRYRGNRPNTRGRLRRTAEAGLHLPGHRGPTHTARPPCYLLCIGILSTQLGIVLKFAFCWGIVALQLVFSLTPFFDTVRSY